MSRLAEVREQRNLSRQELAQKAKCTAEAIRLLENDNDDRLPNLKTAYAIASALGVQVEQIWPPAPKTIPEPEGSGRPSGTPA